MHTDNVASNLFFVKRLSRVFSLFETIKNQGPLLEKYPMNSERVAPSVKKNTHLSSSSDSISEKKGIEEQVQNLASKRGVNLYTFTSCPILQMLQKPCHDNPSQVL
jgi:hypothetical protein